MAKVTVLEQNALLNAQKINLTLTKKSTMKVKLLAFYTKYKIWCNLAGVAIAVFAVWKLAKRK